MALRNPKAKRKLLAKMIMKPSLVISTLTLVCLVSACSRSAPAGETTNPTPSEKRIASTDVVKATIQPLDLTAGESAETTIRLNIQSGYHVNANPPTFPYLKATELQIPATDGVSVGFIVYPNPLTKTFAFAEQPLAVYEGDTALKVNLKAEKSAKRGARQLTGKLQVQACDDQVCYPPGVINLAIPINVK